MNKRAGMRLSLREATMSDNNDRIELQHRLEQARRLSDDATDPTTHARLAVLILSLEADQHHDELRRRSE